MSILLKTFFLTATRLFSLFYTTSSVEYNRRFCQIFRYVQCQNWWTTRFLLLSERCDLLIHCSFQYLFPERFGDTTPLEHLALFGDMDRLPRMLELPFA